MAKTIPFTLLGMQIIMIANEVIAIYITGVFGLMASTATVVWFVSAQFSNNRQLMYDAIKDVKDSLLKKIEYHEKHDDERFAEYAKSAHEGIKQVSDRVWNVELRNAAKDGTLPTEYPIRRKPA